MNTEESIPTGKVRITPALIALQRNLPAVGKGNTATVQTQNRTYSYTYADLADVTEAVLPKLAEHELAWSTQPTLNAQGQFVLRYELLHVSGESISGEYPLTQGTAQAVGSAITYARRYCLCAVTGVAPDRDDDDGAAASARPASAKRVDGVQGEPEPESEQVLTPVEQAAAARSRLADVCTAMQLDLNAVAAEYEARMKQPLAVETNVADIETYTAAIRDGRVQLPAGDVT